MYMPLPSVAGPTLVIEGGFPGFGHATESWSRIPEVLGMATHGVEVLTGTSLCTGRSSCGRNFWVSGLSSTTRATDLKNLFSRYGKVSCRSPRVSRESLHKSVSWTQAGAYCQGQGSTSAVNVVLAEH